MASRTATCAKRLPISARLALVVLSVAAAAAQQPQNPSPMVEHTRAHRRLTQQTPDGRRETLQLGEIFIPAGMKTSGPIPVLFFFHGGTWLPELAGARDKVAVIAIQAGSGSA